MIERKEMLKFYWNNMTLIFFMSIIGMSAVGWWLAGHIEQENIQFLLSSEGIPYPGIIQILLMSNVIGGINLLIFSDLIFKKLMLMWRTVIFVLLTFVSVIAIAVIFRWFPVDMLEAWLGFLGFFILSSIISVSVMLIATKLADKKYGKLLSDYKSKQKESGENQ